jgi:mono/diheme cytochrome c family protein
MRIFWTVVAVIVVQAIAGLIYIYSGSFNVAASSGHSAFMRWVLNTTSDRSVEKHAEGITPPALDNTELINAGFKHYDKYCDGCHGVPGRPESPFQKGLLPEPPKLYEKKEVEDLTPAEEFWVIKHGIKMTAMPAWEVAFSDEEIWQLVAFLQKLPGMSLEEYQQMKKSPESGAQQPSEDID